MPRERRALVYALTAVVLWSTVATAFKLGLRFATPLQLIAGASLISWLIFAAADRRAASAAPMRRQAVLAAMGLGLLNPLLYYLLLLAGYDRLPAQLAQPLNYTWALWLALLALPLQRQPLRRPVIFGILCAIAGVALLARRDATLGPVDPLGVALLLASAVLWALYWLLQTALPVLAELTPLRRLHIGFATATPLLLLGAGAVDGWPAWSPALLGLILWIGAIEMGFTFLLWQRALALTDNSARIGQLIFLSPLLALLPITLVLGEPLRPQAIGGLALILLGLLVAQRDRPQAAAGQHDRIHGDRIHGDRVHGDRIHGDPSPSDSLHVPVTDSAPRKR
ncbi:MAG: DMT family transporter [Pseudomonadota bacterium]